MTQLQDRVDVTARASLFHIEERGSTPGREIRGGITTFVAMSYIVLLNPLILGGAADVTGARLSNAELTTATALAAAVMTILMGLIGNAPLALAAGLGVNGIVAYQLAPAMTWAEPFGLGGRQDGDHGRHRPLYRVGRFGQRGIRDQDTGFGRHDGTGTHGPERPFTWTADGRVPGVGRRCG